MSRRKSTEAARPAARATTNAATRPKRARIKGAREAIVEGSIIDRRYHVRGVIASGGMGVVLDVEHVHTHRRHALKAYRGTEPIPAAEEKRLLDEAVALSAARHPHVVEVYDAGICTTFGPFLVLETLDGRSLETISTTRAGLPVHDAIAIGLAVCAALEHVHARGYIHRDVKPGNLLVTRGPLGREVLKLIDFGLAIPLRDQANARAHERGLIVGTPEYMAQEQLLDADELDASCDVYATAVIVYELLTGALPRTSVSNAHAATDSLRPVSERRPELGKRFDDVIGSALAHDRRIRTASITAFAEALEEAFGAPIRATRLLAGADPNPDVTGPATRNVDPSELFEMGAVPPPLPAHVLARRRHTRAPFTTPIRVTWSGGVADGRTEDISEGGLLMMVDASPAQGAQVELRFEVPGTATRALVTGRVKWAKPGHRRTAVGIEFLSVGDALRRVIAELASIAESERRAVTSEAEKEGDV